MEVHVVKNDSAAVHKFVYLVTFFFFCCIFLLFILRDARKFGEFIIYLF